MSLRLERAFTKSFAYGPSQYANTGSATLTLHASLDQDALGRESCNFENFYVEETQTSDDNDLMAADIAKLGDLGRWYIQVRGTGTLAFYKNGVQASTPVSFDTDDLWYLVDTGEHVQRDFTEVLSLRVWGPSSILTGALFFCHRSVAYNYEDLIVGGAPVSTLADPGSIAANVVRYERDDRSDPPEILFSVVPALSPTEAIVPLQVGRTDGAVWTSGPDSLGASYENSTAKNGTRFGLTDTANTSFSSSIYRLAPAISQVNQGLGTYPPGASNPGSTPTRYSAAFDTDDVLDVYGARIDINGGFPVDDGLSALYDQLVLVRDCASDFFDAYDTGHTDSFAYSWSSPGGAPVDHYAIVVTDQTGDATLGDGTVLQTIDPATSPETVSGMAGPVRVYLLPVTADGSFGCFDYDEFTVAAAGQIIRYR